MRLSGIGFPDADDDMLANLPTERGNGHADAAMGHFKRMPTTLNSGSGSAEAKPVMSIGAAGARAAPRAPTTEPAAPALCAAINASPGAQAGKHVTHKGIARAPGDVLLQESALGMRDGPTIPWRREIKGSTPICEDASARKRMKLRSNDDHEGMANERVGARPGLHIPGPEAGGNLPGCKIQRLNMP